MNTCRNLLTISLFLILAILKSEAQNLDELFIEKEEKSSMVFVENCNPEDMVVVINCSIDNLFFSSNMLPDSDFNQFYLRESNQYIICHEKMPFKLTVSGPNIKSEEIEIFEVDEKYHVYNVTSNTIKGTVHIITNPRNATVIFPVLDNMIKSTNNPIVLGVGRYRVKIAKEDYETLDTLITIERDKERTFNIDLVPTFPRLHLTLKTNDNAPFVKAPEILVDSTLIRLDALVTPGENILSFRDDVEFYKLYEGNFIPVPAGKHRIKISAQGYTPYETTIDAVNGKVSLLQVTLEPVFGYLTFLDRQNAEAARIYINNVYSGNVPVMDIKVRIGNTDIRFEKQGYVTSDSIYSITVEENKRTDIEVIMNIARKINIITEPSNAEVIHNGERIGITPCSATLNEGLQSFLVKKSGFATETFEKKIDRTTPDEETVNFKLRPVSPFKIISEKPGLTTEFTGLGELKNIKIEQSVQTPGEIYIPYGKYKIKMTDNGRAVYRSKINHLKEIESYGKFPTYSRSSFHLLSANYFPGMEGNNFDAHFGRLVIFPKTGISTSLLNADYREINAEVVVDTLGTTGFRTFNTLASHLIFMNWDWRIGGSVLRQLDVCILGQAKYTPGLKILNLKIDNIDDVTMKRFFLGFEVSTRISYMNINLRAGKQYYDGQINIWNERESQYDDQIPIASHFENWVVSLGITFNGQVGNSNNMLRLWNRPFVNPERRINQEIKSANMNKATNNSFKSIFKKN